MKTVLALIFTLQKNIEVVERSLKGNKKEAKVTNWPRQLFDMVVKHLKNVFYKIFFPQPPKPPFYHICQVGDPVLRVVAEKVVTEDIHTPEIQKVISQLVKVMRHYKSHGLSAPQIGIPLRILTMELPLPTVKERKPEVNSAREITELPLTIFINPEMKVLDYDKITFPEGCESLRGYSGDVSRYRSVELKGLDPQGEALSQSFSGWLARIAQHEMDHLQGRLYIDKIDTKTFQNDGWQKINVHRGRVKIKFI